MRHQSINSRSSTPCPRCKRLISINADRCIHCGLARPKFYLSIPVLRDLITGKISFVDGIVLFCVSLYVLALLLDISGLSAISMNIFNLLRPTDESLYKLGMGGRIPMATGRWWTVITATYLHGSLLHIGFNMLWLRRIGPLVEELFGASRFWIIYTISGLSGSILTTLMGTNFFVGASGAIFGLFGALIYYGRHRGGTFGSNIFRQMLIWAGIAFLFGFLAAGVDNWGHLGGFLGGLAISALVGYKEKSRQTLYQHIIAFVLLIFVAICFIFMVIVFFS